MIVPTVPTGKMSSGFGSFVFDVQGGAGAVDPQHVVEAARLGVRGGQRARELLEGRLDRPAQRRAGIPHLRQLRCEGDQDSVVGLQWRP